MNISDGALDSTNAGLERIENMFNSLKNNVGTKFNAQLHQNLTELQQNFEREMEDDFNTPNAIASIYDFVKQANTIIATGEYDAQNVQEITDYLTKIDTVFKCFDFLYNKPKQDDQLEQQVKALVDERNKCRRAKDYVKADELKQKILSMGVELSDNKDGTTTFKIK